MTSRTGKPIIIAAYDPAWIQRFEVERELIFRTCGRDSFVLVEHVGSTAVPGLGAKPIIDIMPGLRSLADAPPLIEKLATIGYEYVPQYEDDMPYRRYFRKDDNADVGGERAFHMHMVETTSEFWQRHLLFRNYLRAMPLVAAEYERLKRDIAARYNANLRADSDLNAEYTDLKTEFVTRIEAAARARIAASTPIVIADYDAAWPARFERQRAEIVRVAGDIAIDVQHVGSTSVPGLAAKPCVDIALGVRSIAEGQRALPELASIGYAMRGGEDDVPDWKVFYKRIDAANETEFGVAETYHLHMVPHDGDRWRAYLAFRDHLRSHPDTAREYERLKRHNASVYVSDRLGYNEAKSEFVRGIAASTARTY